MYILSYMFFSLASRLYDNESMKEILDLAVQFRYEDSHWNLVAQVIALEREVAEIQIPADTRKPHFSPNDDSRKTASATQRDTLC
jgi:hypothetical protein